MYLLPNEFYHIYNRGNRRLKVFFKEGNYDYFLSKVQKHICPYAQLMAFCLLPNHFHLLIKTKQDLFNQELNTQIGIMLRSYTRAINKQEGIYGSLFQQATKAKQIKSNDYLLNCFNYIHRNPLNDGLVKKLEDWRHSSFPFYIGKKESSLVDIEETNQYLGLDFSSYETEIIEFNPSYNL